MLRLIINHFYFQGYPIIAFKTHEEFELDTFYNDIAIMTLNIPLDLSDPDIDTIKIIDDRNTIKGDLLFNKSIYYFSDPKILKNPSLKTSQMKLIDFTYFSLHLFLKNKS